LPEFHAGACSTKIDRSIGLLSPLEPISDPADPRLTVYQNLPDATLHARHGLFMAEGELVVKLAIDSGLALRSIVLTPSRLRTLESWLIRASCPVYLAEPAMLDAVAGIHLHRGVLAAGVRPPARDPLELARRSSRVLILEDLANHDNIGGLFRVAAAFGIGAVVLSPRCGDPLYRKSIRVSMGHALRVPFATLEPWPEGLAQLRSLGTTIAALALDGETKPIDHLGALSPGRPVGILVGAEGPGLSASALAHADLRLTIPMAPGVDSLNVVVAAGIACSRLPGKPA
jgi:tRNA G18 (ribose-2'-O)-methylase SpoU